MPPLAVRLLLEAQQEIEASEAWYRVRSPEAADRFVHEIRRAIALLSESPRMSSVGRRYGG